MQDNILTLHEHKKEDISALYLYMKPLRELLDDDQVTEVCVNRPNEAYVQRYNGWSRHELGFASQEWCNGLANLVANRTKQGVDETNPLLSADLPTGERIQFVLPPAAENITASIRRPSKEVWSIDTLASKGLFDRCGEASTGLDEIEQELIKLKEKKDYLGFIKLAVKAKKNILVSGVTGSGKTSATKALILEVPSDERIITIEDAKELVLDKHPNHVRLFYSKGKQGVADVTPKMLLEACQRLFPTRIFLAELRSDEAFYYIRAVLSHPGSITSIHGHTAELALMQMLLLLRQSREGQALKSEEIKALIYQSIDVVLQFELEGTTRFVKEIWYRPELKREIGNG